MMTYGKFSLGFFELPVVSSLKFIGQRMELKDNEVRDT
jgi:hypothetical protein